MILNISELLLFRAHLEVVRAVDRLTAGINNLIMKLAQWVLKDECNIGAGHHSRLTCLAVTVYSSTETHILLVEVGPQMLSLSDDFPAGSRDESPAYDALVESVSTADQPIRALLLFGAVIHVREFHN